MKLWLNGNPTCYEFGEICRNFGLGAVTLGSQWSLSEHSVSFFSSAVIRAIVIKTDSEIHSSIVCLNPLNVNYLIIEETFFVLFCSIAIFFRNPGINCPKNWLSSLQGKADQFVSLTVRFSCFLVQQLLWYACVFSQNDVHLELGTNALVILLLTQRHLCTSLSSSI